MKIIYLVKSKIYILVNQILGNVESSFKTSMFDNIFFVVYPQIRNCKGTLFEQAV